MKSNIFLDFEYRPLIPLKDIGQESYSWDKFQIASFTICTVIPLLLNILMQSFRLGYDLQNKIL